MKTKVKIEGMSCDSCVLAATQALEGVAGVDEVKVDLASGTGTVKAADEVKPEQLQAALEEIGFGYGGLA
ncbi:MAG: heavy-metal-associated domain-containing protein [Coriobacteriales bacterium]|jgi:copper chaperone CopZ|nr:heavy-metal-associated domain-containing protein [Coriobacteriales bacterium]